MFLKDTSKIVVRTGGSKMNRFDVMREGWKRCKMGKAVTSADPMKFYEHVLEANAVTFALDKLPELVRKFSVFGEVYEVTDDLLNKRVRFEVTNKKLDIYLPTCVRVEMSEV